MINKKNSLYMLIFSYSIFSLAVCMPEMKINIFRWIKTIAFYGILYIAYCLFIIKRKEIKPLAVLFLIIYILFIISRQIVLMAEYMKLYHSTSAEVSTYIVSSLLILIFVAKRTDLFYKISMPLFCSGIILVFILLILNLSKINPYNLYSNYIDVSTNQISITLFDYIVPVGIIASGLKNINRKNVISVLFLIIVFEIILVVSLFSTFNGDLLYSISPLQAVFQITGTKLIRNFDAIYNFFLFFLYFSALICLLWAYSVLKDNFKYFKYGDLFLIIVFLPIVNMIKPVMFFWLELSAIVVLIMGREKSEKS